jgi:hypothetical protein
MDLLRHATDKGHYLTGVIHLLDQKKRRPQKTNSAPLPLLYLTDRQVRARAHQIWLEQGQPEGREHEHWFQALCELSHRLRDQAKDLAGKAELFEVWD